MPVLTATGAGVRHRRRWLFRDLDVSVEPGEIVAIVGPPGSGRTTVLLALARRFQLSAGRVTGSASLGWVPEVSTAEPVLTVREHVRERLLLLGRSPREAGQVPLLGLDPQLKGYELSPYQRHLLGLVLARLEQPRVIALDAVDEGLDAGESRELWAALDALVAEGIAVLVTARELDSVRVSTVVRLDRAAAHNNATPAADAQDAVTEPDPLAEPDPASADEPDPAPGDEPEPVPAPGGDEEQVREASQEEKS